MSIDLTEIPAVAGPGGGGRADVRVVLPSGDFAAQLKAAIEDAHAEGGYVELISGADYVLTGPVEVTDVSVDLRCNGAKIVRGLGMASSESAIKVSHTISAQTACTLTPSSYEYSQEGNLSETVLVTTTLDVVRGDYVKIISDDFIPTSPAADMERQGEIIQVGAVVTEGFHSYGPLRRSFATNIRCAKLTDLPVSITGLDLRDAEGAPVGRNAPLIELIGAVAPYVTGYLHDAQSVALRLVSCVRARTEVRCERIRTSSANFAYGYGVYEVACADGLHDIRASELRHAYTTGSFSLASPNDARTERYGGCTGSVVTVDAINCDAAAADTHADAMGIHFPRVRVHGQYRGAQGYYGGLQFRGYGNSAGEVDVTGPVGFLATLVSDYCGGHSIERLRIYVPPSYLTTRPMIDIDGTAVVSTDQDIRHPIRIGTLELDSQSGKQTTGIFVRKANLVIDRLRGECKHAGATTNFFQTSNGSQITVHHIDLDLRNSSAGAVRLARFNTASDKLWIGGGRIRRGTGAWVLVDFQSRDAIFATGPIAVDYTPTTPYSNLAAGSVANAVLVGESVEYWHADATTFCADADVALTMLSSGTQVFAAVTAARTVTLPAAGLRKRKFTVAVLSGAGAGSVSVGGLLTLTAGQSCIAVCDGAVWRVAS